MGIIRWMRKKTETFKMSVRDWTIFKLDLIIFGMMLGAYLATFVKQYVWCFVAAWLVMHSYYRVQQISKPFVRAGSNCESPVTRCMQQH